MRFSNQLLEIGEGLSRKLCIFSRKIAHFTASGIRIRDLALACNLLYHFIHHLVVFILEFSSPHIILNRAYIDCLRP